MSGINETDMTRRNDRSLQSGAQCLSRASQPPPRGASRTTMAGATARQECVGPELRRQAKKSISPRRAAWPARFPPFNKNLQFHGVGGLSTSGGGGGSIQPSG